MAVLPGTGTLLLNNYWADGQHKVPGIKNVAIHVIFKKKKELIKSVKKYLLYIYEILCKELAVASVTHSLTVAGPRSRSVLFDSLPNNGLTKVFKVSLTV